MVDESENGMNLYLYFDVTNKFCGWHHGGHFINISSFDGDIENEKNKIWELSSVEFDINEHDDKTVFEYRFDDGDARFYQKDVYFQHKDAYVKASFIKPIVNGHCFYEVRYRVNNDEREEIFNDLLNSLILY
jgi:hypothetical protein